jgi:hypothetical protein
MVFTRDRHAIVAVGAGGGDISGEGRGHSGEPKRVGKGVGMSELPAVGERTIGSSGGLIRIAAMPERPGQLDKGTDPDVLPIVKGGIAMLVGPIQRGGGFEMRESCRVVAAQDQRISEHPMAHPERADEGCDWADDRKLVACSSAAARFVMLTFRYQEKPEQEVRSNCRGRIPPFARRLGSEDPER